MVSEREFHCRNCGEQITLDEGWKVSCECTEKSHNGILPEYWENKNGYFECERCFSIPNLVSVKYKGIKISCDCENSQNVQYKGELDNLWTFSKV